MEWQGGNKQRPNYWQWRRSFILGDSNWKVFQVGYPVDWAQTECSAGCDLWRVFFCLFFSKCFQHSTSWCFGSHFFLPRPHRFIAICRCHFLALLFIFFRKKHGTKKLLCQHFTANNCSTLARHALKLICQTTFDSILFKSLLSHAGQLSCRDVTEVTWPKPGIFSCRRRSCSKRRVCFHSNQYFLVHQENVNLSNEQRVC